MWTHWLVLIAWRQPSFLRKTPWAQTVCMFTLPLLEESSTPFPLCTGSWCWTRHWDMSARLIQALKSSLPQRCPLSDWRCADGRSLAWFSLCRTKESKFRHAADRAVSSRVLCKILWCLRFCKFIEYYSASLRNFSQRRPMFLFASATGGASKDLTRNLWKCWLQPTGPESCRFSICALASSEIGRSWCSGSESGIKIGKLGSLARTVRFRDRIPSHPVFDKWSSGAVWKTSLA